MTTTYSFVREPDSLVVDEHRQYWRPERTRLVLLAESHVFTASEELKCSIRPHNGIPALVPRRFVRFVYCLGYGENELLDNPVKGNTGTPQYWKIFHSCIHGAADCKGLLKSKTLLAERIHHKINLLDSLKAQGIWLVDASVNALYHPGNQKPKTAYEEALKASWNEQVRSAILTAKPDGVLCIGQGVAKTLRSELRDLQIPWGAVPQPQARLPKDEHRSILDTYYKAASEPAKVTSLCLRWSRILSANEEKV